MNIFEYDNYRKFLQNQLQQRPRKGHGEVTKIAKFLGVHPTLISQILGDQKHLSGEQALDLCSYLGLGSLETEYFMILVKMNRAGNSRLKQYYKSQILKIREQSMDLSQRVQKERVLTDQERAVFYSSWLFSAVRLFCSLEEKGKTIDEICERFDLERGKIAEILNFLVAVGLVSGEGIYFKNGPQRTHLEAGSPFLVRHHANWRLRSLQQADVLEKSEMMFTAPLSISKKDFAAVREELVLFIQNLSERVKNTEPEELACVNIDLFWIR